MSLIAGCTVFSDTDGVGAKASLRAPRTFLLRAGGQQLLVVCCLEPCIRSIELATCTVRTIACLPIPPKMVMPAIQYCGMVYDNSTLVPESALFITAYGLLHRFTFSTCKCCPFAVAYSLHSV